MKRDMDLIRLLLLTVEGTDYGERHDLDIPGYDEPTIDYNLELLILSGLINGDCSRMLDKTLRVTISGLTWEGHDLLEAIRTDSVWDRTKDFLEDGGLQSVSLEVLKEIASKIAREMLGLG